MVDWQGRPQSENIIDLRSGDSLVTLLKDPVGFIDRHSVEILIVQLAALFLMVLIEKDKIKDIFKNFQTQKGTS